MAENKSNASQYTVSSELMNAYGWLIANTPKDSVVVSPSLKTNIDIAAYTHNRILLARSQNNLISKNELLDRLYVTYALFEISPEIFFETINSSLGVYNFFTAEYNSKAIDSSLRPEKYSIYKLPDDVAQNFLNEYTSYQIAEEIPYRMDYLFVGPHEKELSVRVPFVEGKSLVYQKDGVEIYKLIALE